MMTVTNKGTGQDRQFDVVSANFSREASATEHPVEQGADPTDHVQIRALRINVQALVTASPLGDDQPFAMDDAEQFFGDALGQLLEVEIDGKGVYDNCILEAYPFDVTNREDRLFAARFKQITIAGSSTVSIAPKTAAAKAGAPTDADLGTQGTTEVPTSVAHDVVSFFAGLVGG